MIRYFSICVSNKLPVEILVLPISDTKLTRGYIGIDYIMDNYSKICTMFFSNKHTD